MKIKSYLAKPFAGIIQRKIQRAMHTATQDQQKIMTDLIKKGADAEFGKAHKISQANDYQSFKQAIPIRDYEGFRPYIDKIKEGKHNVLWPGKPQ
jgi:hypothetical protein